MDATAAIQQLKAIVAPRELTLEQRRACLSVRAHLLTLASMARDFNDAADPLRGLIKPINLAYILQRLQLIDGLLADDRRARQVRP